MKKAIQCVVGRHGVKVPRRRMRVRTLFSKQLGLRRIALRYASILPRSCNISFWWYK